MRIVSGKFAGERCDSQRTQNGSRSLSSKPFNGWSVEPRIVFLLAFLFVRDHSRALWIVRSVLMFFIGRNPDYQHLNLTFAINVVKFATIIRFFPKPLKLCAAVFTNVRIPPSLRRTLALWHACYRTSLPRFDKRLNSSGLWSRSGSRRWRNLERTGICPYVNPSYPGLFLITAWNYRTICSCG